MSTPAAGTAGNVGAGKGPFMLHETISAGSPLMAAAVGWSLVTNHVSAVVTTVSPLEVPCTWVSPSEP